MEVAEPLLDPVFWNTNGKKDGWVGKVNVLPTPIEFQENRERERDKRITSGGEEGETVGSNSNSTSNGQTTTTQATISVPISIESSSKSAINGTMDDNGKGKGKHNGKGHFDMSLSIPVSIPQSPPGPEPNGKALTNGKTSTTPPPPTNKKKKSGGGLRKAGPPVTLAAVRAAAAARAADQEGIENGEPPLASKSRLTRAITYMFDSPLIYENRNGYGTASGSSASGETDDEPTSSSISTTNSGTSTPGLIGMTMSSKVFHASVIAESLMMCGISPDKTIRRKLDRFLTKAERGDRRFGGTRW